MVVAYCDVLQNALVMYHCSIIMINEVDIVWPFIRKIRNNSVTIAA